MDHGEQCNMRGGTEFDKPKSMAELLWGDQPNWRTIAENLAKSNESLWEKRLELSMRVSLYRFQRDALAVVMFAVGLSLGWLAAVLL
jgi:hypothetical protein